MGDMRNTYKILIWKPEGKNHSEVVHVRGEIILKLTSGKQGGKLWTGSIWLRLGDQ